MGTDISKVKQAGGNFAIIIINIVIIITTIIVITCYGQVGNKNIWVT